MKVTLRFYDRMDECKLNTTLYTWALAGIMATNLERELTVYPKFVEGLSKNVSTCA